MEQGIAFALAIDPGELQRPVGIAEYLPPDRPGNAERIKIRERVDRRMRDGGAQGARHAERRRVNGPEGRTQDELLRAPGDAWLMCEQRSKILEGHLRRSKRDHQRDEPGVRKSPPPMREPVHARPTANACRCRRAAATMRPVFL